MGTPKYFSYYPNLEYPIRMNRAGVTDNIKIKDYFHHLKIQDNLYANETFYETYTIENGERPDQVSYKMYGDEQYYWIVLQVAGVVDVFQDWPLSSYELDEYVLRKYGSYQEAGATHHYETIEIYDGDGNLIQPGRGGPGPDRGGRAQNGLEVSADYSITYPETPESDVLITRSGFEGRLPACTPISNRQYEFDLNQDKSQIYVLQPKYIADYVREVKLYADKISDTNTELSIGDY